MSGSAVGNRGWDGGRAPRSLLRAARPLDLLGRDRDRGRDRRRGGGLRARRRRPHRSRHAAGALARPRRLARRRPRAGRRGGLDRQRRPLPGARAGAGARRRGARRRAGTGRGRRRGRPRHRRPSVLDRLADLADGGAAPPLARPRGPGDRRGRAVEPADRRRRALGGAAAGVELAAPARGRARGTAGRAPAPLGRALRATTAGRGRRPRCPPEGRAAVRAAPLADAEPALVRPARHPRALPAAAERRARRRPRRALLGAARGPLLRLPRLARRPARVRLRGRGRRPGAGDGRRGAVRRRRHRPLDPASAAAALGAHRPAPRRRGGRGRRGRIAEWRAREPGAYRVEAALPEQGSWRRWIVSNPVYLR